MDEISMALDILVIVVPVTLFFISFVIARQYRALQSVSIFSKMFVEHRLLLSIGVGLFLSLVLAVVFLSAVEFSTKLFFVFAGLFLFGAAGFYFGITLGWGKEASVVRDGISVGQIRMDPLPSNVIVENTSGVIKIVINGQKKWVWFVLLLSQWIFVGLCLLPFGGLMLFAVLQDFLPIYLNISLVGVCVGGFAIYLLYTKFRQTLEYIFDQEIIEIDHLSVKIEKSGFSFKSRKVYPAENIKKITVLFSSGGTNMPVRRSPYVNSNLPVFILWHNHGLKRYHVFGKGVDLADAQNILETIYNRFPQYRGREFD